MGAPAVSEAVSTPRFDAAPDIARRFVEARLAARPLADFPGPLPPDLDAGYACQDAAIPLWPDEIAGWKVGRIMPPPPPAEPQRLAGPVFRAAVKVVTGVTPVPFIAGGFAAVESEYVLRLGADAPPDRTRWTRAQALELVDAMFIGMETAGSPLASINALGAKVTVADFGNNAGLLLGPEITGWRDMADEDLICETIIDGASVGVGGAASLPGGPVGSLVFLLGHCARRGRPLKAGQLITTGAATGVHDIEIGQSARADFGRHGHIDVIAVRAEPAADRE